MLGNFIRYLKKVMAFAKRDFIVLKSYRFALLLNVFSIIMGIATYYFLAHLLGDKGSDALAKYGGSYFPFVLIGISLSNFLLTALNTFSSSILGERGTGTLEVIVTTPTRESLIFLGLALWNFLFSSINVIIYLGIGVVIFNFDVSNIDVVSFGIVLLLATIVFSSLGVISSSFILVFKRGNPITWLFSSVSILVGGVYFPVEILPKYLQMLSKFVPLTYALGALRSSIINGRNVLDLKEEIMFLLIFALVLLPISVLSFKYSLLWVKKNGSLIHR